MPLLMYTLATGRCGIKTGTPAAWRLNECLNMIHIYPLPNLMLQLFWLHHFDGYRCCIFISSSKQVTISSRCPIRQLRSMYISLPADSHCYQKCTSSSVRPSPQPPSLSGTETNQGLGTAARELSRMRVNPKCAVRTCKGSDGSTSISSAMP